MAFDDIEFKSQYAQYELFPVERPGPQEIVDRVQSMNPVRKYAMFSGGDGSAAATHWLMTNVPGCEVAHVETGIGVPATTDHVKRVCELYSWPLTVIRSKEDCGIDYDEIVREHGFPGPSSHKYMYILLKERAIDELVRRSKTKRGDRVALFTGICHDDSTNRSGYSNRVVARVGAKVWANHMYWAGKTFMHHYLRQSGMPRNPVAELLGMSGECLCGAFAKKGELCEVRMVCPKTARRIEVLEEEVKPIHGWGWEGRPPMASDDRTIDMFSPMCVGCLKGGREY